MISALTQSTVELRIQPCTIYTQKKSNCWLKRSLGLRRRPALAGIDCLYNQNNKRAVIRASHWAKHPLIGQHLIVVSIAKIIYQNLYKNIKKHSLKVSSPICVIPISYHWQLVLPSQFMKFFIFPLQSIMLLQEADLWTNNHI